MDQNVRLNKNCVNAAIKAHILSDEEMREIGFTDYNEPLWYYHKKYPKDSSLSFNLTIPKDGSDIDIITLDDDFLQPFDYQCVLNHDPTHTPTLSFREFVEEQMAYLESKGVLEGHAKYDYI